MYLRHDVKDRYTYKKRTPCSGWHSALGRVLTGIPPNAWAATFAKTHAELSPGNRLKTRTATLAPCVEAQDSSAGERPAEGAGRLIGWRLPARF